MAYLPVIINFVQLCILCLGACLVFLLLCCAILVLQGIDFIVLCSLFLFCACSFSFMVLLFLYGAYSLFLYCVCSLFWYCAWPLFGYCPTLTEVFAVLFPQLLGKCQGITLSKDGAWTALPKFFYLCKLGIVWL